MFASLVFPGAALVRASFVRVSAFNKVDLPTFERPPKAIWARPSAGTSSARPSAAALVTNSVLRIFNRLATSDWRRAHLGSTSRQPPTASRCASMRNGIVRNGRLNLGVRSRWRHRGQRAGERYLEHLVHRVDHVNVERVEYVLGDVGEIFFVVAR